jgi:hypothetical protein
MKRWAIKQKVTERYRWRMALHMNAPISSNKSADIFNVKCKCGVILPNFLFFQTVKRKKLLKLNTKIVATIFPSINSV